MGVQKVKIETIRISPRQILKTVYTPNLENQTRGTETTFQIIAGITLRSRGKTFSSANLQRVTQVSLIDVARQSSTGTYIHSDTASSYNHFPVSAYLSGQAVIPVQENWVVISGASTADHVIGTIKRYTISPSGAPPDIQEVLRRRL